MTQSLLKEFESHKPLLEVNARIDILIARGDVGDDGELKNNALNHGGYPCLGLARKTSTKDRAKGMGDAEILLDGDWWDEHTEAQQRALLDHELHHLAVAVKHRQYQYDDLGRPKLRLRKHDVDVGWFKVVADRHGKASMEQIQAQVVFDQFGQSFWPQLCPGNPLEGTEVTISSGGQMTTMSGKEFTRRVNSALDKKAAAREQRA